LTKPYKKPYYKEKKHKKAYMQQVKKSYHKKPNLRTKTAKYIKAVVSGKTKEDAKIVANYKPTTTTYSIENTKTYQAIEQKYFKDYLEDSIGKKEVADKLASNIKSENGGISNQAINLYLSRVEPIVQDTKEPDKIIVVLK